MILLLHILGYPPAISDTFLTDASGSGLLGIGHVSELLRIIFTMIAHTLILWGYK